MQITLNNAPHRESQGIVNMNRNGNSANFFSYVCNGKKLKKSCLPLLEIEYLLVLDVCLL